MHLVPLRIAAANGTVAQTAASAAVAAGFTLLQRCVPLVRSLAGRRSALLLPQSKAALTALAASDGRGALLLDPAAPPHTWARQLQLANVGAIFTLNRFLGPLGAIDLPRIVLDDAPTSAQFLAAPQSAAREVPRTIDLGSHFGLELTGTADDPLREEEFVCFYRSGAGAAEITPESLTHRALVDSARKLETDRTAPALISGLILPLLAGRDVLSA